MSAAECVCSVIQRMVVKPPADFDDLDALAQWLIEVEPRYNATAAPFDWRPPAPISTVQCIEMRRSGPFEQPAA